MKSLIQTMYDFDLIDSATGFIKKLNQLDKERASRTGLIKKKTFAPSGVGYGKGRCARYWYYAFGGTDGKDEPGYHGIRNMENGTDRHARFEELLKLMGDSVIAIEEEINSEYPPVRGFIDGQVHWNSVDWIIEFKTTKQGKFKSIKASGKPPSYHIVQLCLYMYIKKFTHGMLIYEAKDSHDLFAVPIKMEGELDKYTQYMVEWLNNVYKIVNTEGKMPERCFTEKSRECGYCPFKKTCWNDDREPEVDIKRLKEFKY